MIWFLFAAIYKTYIRFLKKIAKKANPSRRVCPNDIRVYNVFEMISGFDQQVSVYRIDVISS